MIRYVALLRCRPDISRDEFLVAWMGKHLALAWALPNVQRVEFQPAVYVDEVVSSFDGAGFLEFRTIDELRESLSSEEARALRAHTATFAEELSAVRVVVGPNPQETEHLFHNAVTPG